MSPNMTPNKITEKLPKESSAPIMYDGSDYVGWNKYLMICTLALKLLTLSRRICVVEINALWLFRYLQLAKKHTKVVSFHRLSGRDWNDLPDSLISSAEMSDDCVSKFASLMRARD